MVECAAVIGKEFYTGAVRDLLPESLRTDARDLIRSLVRKELVRTDRSTIPGEDTFRFRHILIRDAAYNAIPKERRADLHEEFADWIVSVAGDRAEEQDEIVGYHLEQAFRYREALGPLDDRARARPPGVGTAVAAAGRAHGRHDLQAAANLLGRASALLDPADPARVALLPDLSAALSESGSTEESTAVLREARARAEEIGDPEIAADATVRRGCRGAARPLDLARSDALEASRRLRAVRERARPQQGLATDRGDRVGPRAGGQAARGAGPSAGARRARPRSFETAEVLHSITSAIVRGPTPVGEGIARVEGILGSTEATGAWKRPSVMRWPTFARVSETSTARAGR